VKGSRGSILACALLASASGIARAQEAPAAPVLLSPAQPIPAEPTADQPTGTPLNSAITITLQSGEIIKGTVKASEKDAVVLAHAILGEVRLPRIQVAVSEPALPPPPPPPPTVVEVSSEDVEKAAVAAQLAKIQAAEAEAKAKTAAAAKPATPEKLSLWAGIARDDEKHFLDGWQRSVEFGMNTSNGNNDSFNYRNSVALRRGTKKMATAVDFSYNYARNNTGEVANRGELRGRNDFHLGDTDWQFWVSGGVEVDKRSPWEARVSFNTGPAYTFIKDEKTTLVGRVGVGGYREVDGGNNDIQTNAFAAIDLSQRLAERTTMYANSEMYPDLADLERVRTVSRAGVTYIIDPESKTTLKFGAEHRYNSDVGPRDNNDVDMFVTLGFTF
jgi:putative salt-induced outer membrane protein YdiY